MTDTNDKIEMEQICEPSLEIGATEIWTADQITNEVFERKLNFCSMIFGQWLQPLVDLSKSTILDFGCGDGTMALGIALHLKAQRVIGVDAVPDFEILPRMSQEQIRLSKLPFNLEFHLIKPNA
ncbi:MAG TPA: hypothetical protein VLK33_22805, partial [Terriglobales bacterium]|nr:hypothetical protein [Terriglobales bacterium]